MQSSTMQFKQGTRVFSSDAQDVGKIDRIVIDPRTRQATDVILRKGGLIVEDKVVPIEHVVHAADDVVTLRETADEVDKLIPFEEDHYVPTDEDITRDYASDYAYPLYAYPPVGNLVGDNIPTTSYIETERNIPSNTEALREGSKVVSLDDKHIGNIDCVLLDSDTKQVTHLVISQGILFKDRKIIPADWITEVTDSEVKLAVNSRILEHLTDYKE